MPKKKRNTYSPPKKFIFTDVAKMALVFAERHERMAKVLRSLDLSTGIVEISTKWSDTEDHRIIGEILSMDQDGNLHVRVIAADYIDHKMRNISARGFKRRTYPVHIMGITGIKPVKKEDIPLYINMKYLSPQFKNKYLT